MSEDKIELKQAEEFIEELSDEALDREGARNCLLSACVAG